MVTSTVTHSLIVSNMHATSSNKRWVFITVQSYNWVVAAMVFKKIFTGVFGIAYSFSIPKLLHVQATVLKCQGLGNVELVNYIEKVSVMSLNWTYCNGYHKCSVYRICLDQVWLGILAVWLRFPRPNLYFIQVLPELYLNRNMLFVA